MGPVESLLRIQTINSADPLGKLAAPPGEDRGRCAGYRLAFTLRSLSSTFEQTRVYAPNGVVFDLIDDGGCHSTVQDNRSFSFDTTPAGDGRGSFAVPNPDDSWAGEYQASFLRPDGLLVSEVVNLPAVTRLEVPAPLVDWSLGSTSLTPVFEWTDDPNAASWEIYVVSGFGSLIGGGQVTEPLYDFAATPLLDGDTAAVTLTAYDSESFQDATAVATSARHEFAVDDDGADSIVVSGALLDYSGAPPGTGYVILGSGSTAFTRLTLPPGSSSYQTRFIKNAATCASDTGTLIAAIDLDASQVWSAGDTFVLRPLPAPCADRTEDLAFLPSVERIGPPPGAAATGDTPTFSWVDWSTTRTAQGVPAGEFPTWSYLFIATDYWWADPMYCGVEGGYRLAWALPPGTTSLDLANLPAQRTDIAALYFDPDGVGGPDPATCSSLPDLSQSNRWAWRVVVHSCAWDDEGCFDDQFKNGALKQSVNQLDWWLTTD